MKSLKEYILERLQINFGSAKSEYGQCIILAGGPGSGKGYIERNHILANYKIMNVDDLKKKYIKLQKKGLIDDEYQYDLTKPEDTFALHAKVKQHGWKNKERKHFWASQNSKVNKESLANILFDMVAGDPEDVLEIIAMAKPIGYKITLIWICANMQSAIEGNAKRDRKVPLSVLEKGHKEAYETINAILDNKYPEITDGIDYMWIALSAGPGRVFTKEYEKDQTIKIKKDSNGNFNYDRKDFVEKFLSQQMPLDPESKEAKKEKEEKRKRNLTPSKYGLETKFSR